VPTIAVATPLLDLGKCFLRHPYRCFVELRNDSDLPAKYELVPCSGIDGLDVIVYSSPQPQVGVFGC
jgi:hydrocephalus-inducing protein